MAAFGEEVTSNATWKPWNDLTFNVHGIGFALGFSFGVGFAITLGFSFDTVAGTGFIHGTVVIFIPENNILLWK